MAPKTPFFVIDPFCTHHSICLKSGFWHDSFVWKRCVSNLSTFFRLNNGTLVLWKRSSFSREFVSKLKYWNRLKFQLIVTKACGSLKRRAIPFLEEPVLFLLVLKWNLSGNAFSSVKTKTNSNIIVKLAERTNHSFLLSAYFMNHLQTSVLFNIW